MRTTLLASVAAFSLATPAMASPTAGVLAGAQPQTESAITQVHGRSHGCAVGPAGRWHWSDRWGRIHPCAANPGNGWRWLFRDGRRGWWHDRDRRWHDRH